MTRKICVVVASRANYGRVKAVMNAIKGHELLELQLIAGASTLLDRFGRAVDVMVADGFTPNERIFYIVEGETLTTQAKSTGLGIIELANSLDNLKPDIVVTVADRFETMATAVASTYLNIPLAHIQGGEVSGNIDDRVRHAITKLSDIHFPATEESRERLVKMGEAPEYVFNFGCPAMDLLVQRELLVNNEVMGKYGGVGSHIVDWQKPYLLVVQHPVTTSYGNGRNEVMETLEAVKQFKDIQKVVLWPNIDAGSDDVSKGMRVFREHNMDESYRYYKNFSPEDYARVVNNSVCCVGNSSSFIREGSFLGVPAVMVGDRQRGREHGRNVVYASYAREDIAQKVQHQLAHGRYPSDDLFGLGDAGVKMADVLATLDLNVQKQNTY